MVFANLHIIDWAIVIIYMVAIFYVGARFTEKASHNLTSFFLSGRSLPWWLAGTSVVAGHFSASQPVNVISAIRRYGIEHLWIYWYFIPAAMFAAIFVAKLWRRTGIITHIELIRLRTSGPAAHFQTIFNTIYQGTFIKCYFTAASFIALEKMFAAMVPGVNPVMIIFVICLIALAYSIMSGLYAVVVTDFIQLIFASVGTITLVIYIYYSVGGPTHLVEEVQAIPGKQALTHVLPSSPNAVAARPQRIYLYKTPIKDLEALKQVEACLQDQGVKYTTLVDKYILLKDGVSACDLRTELFIKGLQPKAFKTWNALGMENWDRSVFLDKAYNKDRTDVARRELSEALALHLTPLEGVKDAQIRLQAAANEDGTWDKDALATQLFVDLVFDGKKTELDQTGQAWISALANDLGVTSRLNPTTEIIKEVEPPPKVAPEVKAWLDFIGIVLLISMLWSVHGHMSWGGGDPQRMMATRSERDSMLTVIWSNIVERGLVFWLWIIIAMGSLVLLGGNAYDDQKAFAEMGLKFLPIGLKGLFVAAVFAALMSTIDTNINSTASFLVNDLYKNYFVKAASDKHYVLVSRICTALALLLSFVMWATLLSGSQVLDNWKMISMMLCYGGAGLFQWLWWRVNAWTGIAAMFGSILCFIMLKFVLPNNFEFFNTYNLVTDYYPIGLLVTNLFTAICWVSVTLLTKPTEMEKLKEYYRRVHPPGFWGPVREALEEEVVAPPSDVKTDTITWLLAIAVVLGFVFGFGNTLLGNYLLGIILLVVSGVSTYFMLKLISKTEGYVKGEEAES